MTRSLLSQAFPNNPLAIRAMEVFEQILPNNPIWVDGDFQQPNDNAQIDFSVWPVDSSDPLSSFGWAEFGMSNF